MSSKLEYSQVIALSPNRLQTFSATLPSPFKPTYFAFGCESLINIVNRTDFSRITIPTPDATSPVISLTFSGTNYLFCLNKNGILYAYLRNSFSSGPIGSYNINCTPISLAASNRFIFYIYDKTLFQLSIDDFLTKKREPKKLTDQNEEKFTELSISPCGRALTIFTIGEKYPEIWFYPFREKQHSNLPIRSNLIDFKWGLSETLICVTATEDGIIRVWEEQTDSLNLHQKSWFHFDQQILFSCFCFPIDGHHQPQHFHAAQSSNSSVFPLSKSYPCNIVVGLKNGLIYVFKENNQPQLSEITHFKLNDQTGKSDTDKTKVKNKNKNNLTNSNCITDISFNGDLVSEDFNDEKIRYFAIADYRDDFIENQFKMLITLTLFSKKSLSFHYIEIGDASVLTTVPYRVSFISSNIKSIETNEFNHILTKMEDNKLVNWSLVKVEAIRESQFEFIYNIKTDKVKKYFGVSVVSNVVSLSQITDDKNVSLASYKLDFEPIFKKFVDINKMVVGFLLSNDGRAVIAFINEDSNDSDKFVITTFPVVNPPDFQVDKVAFHSTDLFAAASDEDIQVYIFQDGQYNHILSLHHENNSIIFLPKLLLAVASKRSITFFTLSSQEFTKLTSIQSTHITAMSYINKSLIVSTKHVLFRLYLPKEMFPLPLPVDDDAVYTTMLSLCHFSVIQDFINNKKPTLNSFLTHIETESFHLKPSPTIEPEKITEPNSNLNTDSNLNNDSNLNTNSNSIEKVKKELPYFDEFWNSLPKNWQNVDEYGMKFIFSMLVIHLHSKRMNSLVLKLIESVEKRGQIQEKNLLQIAPKDLKKKVNKCIQKSISFLSIWGLLSTDQSNLAQILSFKSITEICKSYLPLWMKNDLVLKKTIDKFILDNIPAPDASNYDFDAFVLLCVILDKKTFAAKIAKRSHNNNKISSFLENIESTKNEKIEKSAFAAYGQHRFSLAAMFFILRGMTTQAISALSNDDQNPFLVILIARLIGYQNWQSLIKKEDFYSFWWSSDEASKEKAIETISKFKFKKIKLHKYFIGDQEIVDENADVIHQFDLIREQISLMINASKFEMLRRLKFHFYRRYLLDIQKIPYLIIKYINNETAINVNLNENNTAFTPQQKEKETEKNKDKKVPNNDDNDKSKNDEFSFSFGAGIDDIDDNLDFDDFSSDEEEEEENFNVEKDDQKVVKSDFKSTISDMFLADNFESIYADPLLLSEEYIITLLSELYNRKFSKQTIQFLLCVAKELLALPQSLHIISMIMFSITFSLSDFTWMAPIIQFNFDPLYIITVLDHYNELMTSEDEENNPLIKTFKKSAHDLLNSHKKVKHYSNPNLNAGHHIIKSNSVNSFNIVSQISQSSSFSKIKKNVFKNQNLHAKELNVDRSDTLINIIDTDNYSSSDEEEERGNEFYSTSINKDEDDLPDFFSVICPNVVPTKSDKELACFVAFDRMLTVLNELLTNSNPTIFTSFLHHRHRLMYRKIKSFRFSQAEIAKDLDSAGLKCQNIERMRHTRESRTWALSLADKFTSPFFTSPKVNSQNNASSMANYSFNYTASYNIKTNSSHVYDVCIDRCDNQQIAIAAKQVITLHAINPSMSRDMSYSIAEHELKHTEIDGFKFNSPSHDQSHYEDEFQSPLLSFLTQQKIARWQKVTQEVLLTRSFDVKWPKANGQTAKTVKATCVSSHPSKGCFVSGDSMGNLHYWKFNDQNGVNSSQALNVAKFFKGDFKIRSIQFNSTGDRICSLDNRGRVCVSDFVGFHSFNIQSQIASISWLNNDNQFVVCSSPNNEPFKEPFGRSSSASPSNANAAPSIPSIPKPTTPTLAKTKYQYQANLPKASPSVDNLHSISPMVNSPYQNRSIAQSTTFTAGKRQASLLIYDILVGDQPVAVFDTGKSLPLPRTKIPIDVLGPLVLSGHADGSAAIFDVRTGLRLGNLPYNNQAVTAVRFDDSGSFFVTGGMDNKVVIADTQSFAVIDQLDDVLPNYDAKSRKRGIFSLAVSKQTIVACGYSSHIHVWTKTSPSPM